MSSSTHRPSLGALLLLLGCLLPTLSLAAPTDTSDGSTPRTRRVKRRRPRPPAATTTPAPADISPGTPDNTDAPTAKVPPTKATGVPARPTTSPSGENLDFNLLDEGGKDKKAEAANAAASAASALDVQKLSNRRRQMLQIHQGLGFAMLGALVATEVIGQLNFDDKYVNGGDTGHFQLLHIGLATATLGLFFSVGMLGLFAPTPYEKKLTLDTATIHKGFMALATAGMVAQLILGIAASSHEGSFPQQRNYVVAHQIVGYITLGATAAGATVLVF